MFLIDSHCHIIDDDALIQRAYKAGVKAMLSAGNDLDERDEQLVLCRKMQKLRLEKKEYPYMWTSVGIHPDSAPAKLEKIQINDIIDATQDDFVVAIGECGLDYHYGAEYKNEQKEMFMRHVEAAGLTDLPLMIHQRDAEDDLLSILRKSKEKYPELKGVIHCFTSTIDFAKAVLELGFYISASGIITFKNATDIADVFKTYPLNKILVETDTPYLAPIPHRGQINEPAFVVHTAKKLADIRNIELEKISEITSYNFYSLYKKAYIFVQNEQKMIKERVL